MRRRRSWAPSLTRTKRRPVGVGTAGDNSATQSHVTKSCCKWRREPMASGRAARRPRIECGDLRRPRGLASDVGAQAAHGSQRAKSLALTNWAAGSTSASASGRTMNRSPSVRPSAPNYAWARSGRELVRRTCAPPSRSVDPTRRSSGAVGEPRDLIITPGRQPLIFRRVLGETQLAEDEMGATVDQRSTQ